MVRGLLFSRKSFWVVTGAICLVIATIAVTGVSQNSGVAKQGKPPIKWTPSSLNATVSAGVTANFSVSLLSSQDLSNVNLRVVPELQPFIQTTPQAISQITSGQPVNITLQISTPAGMLPQTNSGVIQVRTESGNTIAIPLPITIAVQWQRLQPTTPLDFSVNYPPTYVPTFDNAPGLDEVGFSENQAAYNAGVAPVLVITSQPVSSGQTLRDWIHSFGVDDSGIAQITAGNLTYLMWTEAGGEGDGSAISYSIMAPDGNAVTVTVHSTSLAGSPAFNNILSSLTFTGQ